MKTDLLDQYVDHIIHGAALAGFRTGQYLFNHLPAEVANAVGGSFFDPFHRDLSAREIAEWIDNHLIFDGDTIVCVFTGNKILWERE